MKTLIIGGTGYIGGHVAERLQARGFEVTVLARGRTQSPLPASIPVIKGDRHVAEDLAAAARIGFDAVVDINAYHREETQAVVDAFDGRTSRFVHLSTVSVNTFSTGYPLRESDPLVSDPAAGYAFEKAECERALHQAHARSDFPFVIVRPCVVFGPRDRISRENYYLKRMLAKEPIILPDGGFTPTIGIYVRDVADTIAGAIISERAPGSSYHVAMRERVSLANHVANIANRVGCGFEVVPVPSRVLARAGFNMSWFPYYLGDRSDFALDPSTLDRDLDVRLTPYGDALGETIDWFLARGPESLPSIEDRFPPVMGRNLQAEFARCYAASHALHEEAVLSEFAERLQESAS